MDKLITANLIAINLLQNKVFSGVKLQYIYINMYIPHTVLIIFVMVIVWRICLKIRTIEGQVFCGSQSWPNAILSLPGFMHNETEFHHWNDGKSICVPWFVHNVEKLLCWYLNVSKSPWIQTLMIWKLGLLSTQTLKLFQNLSVNFDNKFNNSNKIKFRNTINYKD